jgi:hypothetical protein
MKGVKVNLGIIGIIIGVIWYIYSFSINPTTILEQTFQYVSFAHGSIFLVGGIILLKMQSIINNIQEISANQENTEKEFSCTHKVKLLTGADGLSLRKSPNPNADPFTKIPDGTEVQLLKTGDTVSLNDKKGYWYKITTKEKVSGWCFSGSIEKI